MQSSFAKGMTRMGSRVDESGGPSPWLATSPGLQGSLMNPRCSLRLLLPNPSLQGYLFFPDPPASVWSLPSLRGCWGQAQGPQGASALTTLLLDTGPSWLSALAPG